MKTKTSFLSFGITFCFALFTTVSLAQLLELQICWAKK